MVKIISVPKREKPEEKKYYRTYCRKCGCRFVYDSDDINYDEFESIDCPNCGKRLYHHGMIYSINPYKSDQFIHVSVSQEIAKELYNEYLSKEENDKSDEIQM